MAYYVLASGGAKYGPVDLETLKSWVGQGRILAETLLEDTGSGVKVPARAIRGLSFPSDAPGISPVQPPSIPGPGPPSTPLAPQSNYLRPGQGTGGSPHNLFLPSSAQADLQPSNLQGTGLFLPNGAEPSLRPSGGLFLPNVDSKWAWHGLACVAVAGSCVVLIGLTHWYFDRILMFAFALPIFGVQRGFRGMSINRPLALVVITLNVCTLIGALALVFRGALL